MDSRTYKILGLLGEGGFGKVYRARLESDTGFRQEVALKLLHDPNPGEAVLQRFRDEARILGLVRDRAFVSVSPPVQLEGRWGVVMEFVEGASLDALIRRFGGLPPAAAAEVIGEVARAFHAAGQQVGPEGRPIELIHRDLKPANLQVTRTGEVKVLDFGIARADFQHREFQTQASIGGTPGYIAPERIRGVELPAGDIYSLGVVLAECLHGKETDALAAVSRTITETGADFDLESGRPLATGEIDGDAELALSELVHAMCDESPERRPSARQVERRCAEIARIAGGLGLREWAEDHVPETMAATDSDALVGSDLVTTLRQTVSTGTVEGEPTDRRPWPIVVAVALVGVVLAGGAVWQSGVLSPQVPPQEPPEVDIEAAPSPTSAPASAPTPQPEPAVVPEPEPEVASAPEPVPAAAPASPPVRVWVKTKPFGSVQVDGKQAQTDQWIDGVRSGRRVLELRANDGRTHSWAVELPAGQDSRLCWDFDKGAPC